MVSLGRIAVPWIVVTLVFLSTIRTSCAQNEFCYKMSWGAFNETLQKYEFDALVRPVTAFPAEHALVSTYGCMSEGDRIPHLGMSCPPLESDNAGEAWYAYDYPKSFSSNTGFEEAEYSTLYFIIDDVGKASFIINHDKPQNSDGGRAYMDIFSDGLAGDPNISSQLRDDPKEFGLWNVESGELLDAWWKWSSCCTDGGVLGFLPSTDYCLTLKWKDPNGDAFGIQGIKIGTFNELDNSMSFREVDISYGFTSGIEVCAFSCEQLCTITDPDLCEQEEACAVCTAEDSRNVCNPDSDGDGLGDLCDPCPYDPDNDVDGDGVCGDVDNCNDSFNPDQLDSDSDGIGDVCDACPLDPDNDVDNDGICGDVDNCPEDPNPDQKDTDGDRIGDACDPCYLESRYLQSWSIALADEGCGFNTESGVIVCYFDIFPYDAGVSFSIDALDGDSLEGAIGSPSITGNDLAGRVDVEIPLLDLSLALSQTGSNQDSFAFMLTGLLGSGIFNVINQEFQVTAVVDTNNGGAGFDFTVDSGDAVTNTLTDGCFDSEIIPEFEACQADSNFDCYAPGTAPAVRQGSLLRLRFETAEPFVVVDSIGLLSFTLTFEGGGSSTSTIITAPGVFTNALTTVSGEGTKVVLVTTALPAGFYEIADTGVTNAQVSATGILNFSFESVRRHLDSSRDIGTATFSRRLREQTGGFAVEGITLASPVQNVTSGSGGFLLLSLAIHATCTALVVGVLVL